MIRANDVDQSGWLACGYHCTMVRRIFLACLISVLALLQGIAPLIHAHASGTGTAGGVHVDGIAKGFAALHAPGETSDVFAPLPDEGTAVGVGPEIRDRILQPAAASVSTGLVVPPVSIVRIATVPSHATSSRQVDSLRPPAHAPPRLQFA